MTSNTWYRFESVRYASSSYDETGEPVGRGSLRVETRTYRVIKETPCGVRLDTGRFVKMGCKKMFAHPTKAEALEAFIARKKRYARILNSRLEDAEEAIRIAERREGLR